MSLEVLNRILNSLGIYLDEYERKELYENLVRDFGIIGKYDECMELEKLYNDEFYRRKIEEYIKKYLERKSLIAI